MRPMNNASALCVDVLHAGSSAHACGSQFIGRPPRAGDPGLQRPRCLRHSGPEFLLAASVPEDSCTSPRRHGSITHQPQDAAYGGFGPVLP